MVSQGTDATAVVAVGLAGLRCLRYERIRTVIACHSHNHEEENLDITKLLYE